MEEKETKIEITVEPGMLDKVLYALGRVRGVKSFEVKE